MDTNRTDCEDFVQRFVGVQARLYGYIATLVPSRADADELFQQTSLVLWRKHEEFDPSRDFLRWACGIAHNLIRNFRKQHRRGRAPKYSEEFMFPVASGVVAGGSLMAVLLIFVDTARRFFANSSTADPAGVSLLDRIGGRGTFSANQRRPPIYTSGG